MNRLSHPSFTKTPNKLSRKAPVERTGLNLTQSKTTNEGLPVGEERTEVRFECNGSVRVIARGNQMSGAGGNLNLTHPAIEI